ncbi:NirD/YgiW/YdeI family stress tolerance protein [Acinetobacter sp. 187]|nr:NirD/YgiW/YdeI family stress tolerance protein [Acinetobacter lanii]NHC04808.1 NirD/YgiW/YdeI family stress tolerance protein [Acinetobacter lanii]
MKLLAKALIATGFIGATTLAIATNVINPIESTPTAKTAVVNTAVPAQAPVQALAVNQTAIAPVSQTLVNGNGNVTETAVNINAISAQIVTVKQALTLADDSHVQLKGHIVKSLGDEKYQFRDTTGTITVDIDDELWMGKAISANAVVTLEGEVDIDHKPMKRVEIDVDAVTF